MVTKLGYIKGRQMMVLLEYLSNKLTSGLIGGEKLNNGVFMKNPSYQ